MKLFRRPLATLCVLGIFPASLFAQFGDNAPRVGSIPPPLQLEKMIQGPAVAGVNWQALKGKLVVLEFWNTSCKPCIEAIPHLNQLAEQFKTKPVVFLSISDDREDHLKDFLKQHPISTWLALDAPTNATESAFGLHGYGIIVLIDPAGTVSGITLPSLLQEKHLENILAGRPVGLPRLTPVEPSISGSPKNTVALPKDTEK
jgi:thiol-disulfide isomerase/thioredoxin